jgi:purine-binding chemotaxis protein CheW
MKPAQDKPDNVATEYVTVTVGAQLFGLPIARVQDVFVPERLTRVPLAPPEVAGILNLRGRVVTVIDMRSRLDLGRSAGEKPMLAVGIAHHTESYGLLVDSVGEVVSVSDAARESTPANLDPRLAGVATGICRLDDRLMVVLDVDRILELQSGTLAA